MSEVKGLLEIHEGQRSSVGECLKSAVGLRFESQRFQCELIENGESDA